MKKNERIPDDASRLRMRAEEEFARKQTPKPAAISEAEAHRLLHELQVHQIELEMQNESMRQIAEKAEHAARQYADLYEEIYDYSPSAYFTLDRSGMIRKLNLSAALLLEHERLNLVGNNFRLFVEDAEEHVFQEFLEQIFAIQRRVSCEVRLRVQSNHAKIVRLEARVAEDEITCLVTAVDITEHVTIEQELRDLNAQINKDALIKAELLNEVNHRVKNNLMMIIGLILAEKRHAIADKNDAITFTCEKFELHIRGLLKVHQMLSDRQWAPMKISELAHHICSIVLTNSETVKQVALRIAESTIEVLPRQANNLALILNELTVNSLKYAFAQSAAPAISVDIFQEEGMTVLEYRDNGAGYPSEVLDDGRQRVGIRLIRQLVENIPGSDISFRNDGGAVVKMRFPVT